MTQVAVHIPSSPLQLSETALAHLRNRLAQATGTTGLRLSLTESGCSGYMYELEYLTEAQQAQQVSDLVPASEQLPLYVPRNQLHLIQGTRVDYVTAGLNAALRFENPNSQASCGCGESFSFSTDESPSSSAD